MASRLDKQLEIVADVLKHLINERRQFSHRRKQLNMENQQLRTEKKALLDYVRELEKFSVDKIDIKELKRKVFDRVEP